MELSQIKRLIRKRINSYNHSVIIDAFGMGQKEALKVLLMLLEDNDTEGNDHVCCDSEAVLDTYLSYQEVIC